ncbi:MAG: hypothetical protein ACM359_20735 [Bacillota bacterium]
MFKLMRLAFYSLIGYALYELYQNLIHGRAGVRQGEQLPGRAMRADVERALESDAGRMMNMTGTGRGTTEQTLEPSGMSVSHPVGRGVV